MHRNRAPAAIFMGNRSARSGDCGRYHAPAILPQLLKAKIAMNRSTTRGGQSVKKVTKKSFDTFLKFIRGNDHVAAAQSLREMPQITQAIYTGSSQKYDSQTLLMIAVKFDAPEIAHHLIDAGADVNFIDKEGGQSWHGPIINLAVYCAVVGSYHYNYQLLDAKVELLKRLLEEGADLNVTDSRGKSAYRRFIEAVHTRTADAYFLRNGVESSDENVLRSASYVRRIHDLLVEFGAEPKDLETLTMTQAKRIGMGEFVVANLCMPSQTWGTGSFENLQAWHFLCGIFNVKGDLSDSLRRDLDFGRNPGDRSPGSIARLQASAIAVCETIATMIGSGQSNARYYFGVFLDGKPTPCINLRKDAVDFVESILEESDLKKDWAQHEDSFPEWQTSVSSLRSRLANA